VKKSGTYRKPAVETTLEELITALQQATDDDHLIVNTVKDLVCQGKLRKSVADPFVAAA